MQGSFASGYWKSRTPPTGIFEQLAHFGHRPHGPGRLAGEPAPEEDPEIPHEHAGARQHQEFGELPAVDVALVGRVDRHLLAPERIFLIHGSVSSGSQMKSTTSTVRAGSPAGSIM